MRAFDNLAAFTKRKQNFTVSLNAKKYSGDNNISSKLLEYVKNLLA